MTYPNYMKAARAILIVLLLLFSSSAPGYALTHKPAYPAGHYSQLALLHSKPASATSGDETADEYWALNMIQAPEAWQITSGSQDILIAILDTGIDPGHEELVGKVQTEVNFTQSPTVDETAWL